MQSKITLIGMYNFDNSLFDGLTFPTGIDRDLAISRILNKSEEFELVYSDFDYLQERIEIWAKTWERTFKKWVDALSIDYDPLYNYDRKEIYTDTRSRDYSDTKNRDYTDANSKNLIDKHTRSYADTESETSTSSSNTVTGSESSSDTEQKKSAYDEAGYSDRQKEMSEAVTNQTGSGNASGSASKNASSNEVGANTSNETATSNSNEKGTASGISNEVEQHEAHLFGNIGIVSSQQMLESELKIAEWNLYEHISDIFIDEFCILVY